MLCDGCYIIMDYNDHLLFWSRFTAFEERKEVPAERSGREGDMMRGKASVTRYLG